jgi:GntR family transcriptional regulator
MVRFFRFQTKDGVETLPTSRIAARDVLDPPSPVAEKLALKPPSQVIRLKRVRSIDANPVIIEEIWLPKSRYSAILNVDLTTFGDLLYPFYERVAGQIVSSADDILTVELADETHANQLGLVPGAPLIVIERIAYDPENRPIEWRRSYGAAERFRYHAKVR